MPEVTQVSVEIAGTEISFETGQAGQAGQRRGRRLRRGHRGPLHRHRRKRPRRRLPPAHRRRRGADVRGREDPRLVLQARRSRRREGHADRAPDRPPASARSSPRAGATRRSSSRMPLSVDHVTPYDILAMNGASAALMVSDIPFPTPVGAVRIGKIDGNFVINPSEADLAEGLSDLDLIVAGTEEAILMVEAGASEIPEAEILDALDIAHGEIKKLCALQRELREKAGKEKASRRPAGRQRALQADQGRDGQRARPSRPRVEDKLERQDATKAVEEQMLEQLRAEDERPTPPPTPSAAPRSSSPSTSWRRTIIRERIAVRKVPARRPRGAARSVRSRSRSARAARARLGAVHARADAGPERRGARHHARGDAARHARARDLQALLPPLQLPAVLGRGGRLHARARSAATSATARSPSGRSCR